MELIASPILQATGLAAWLASAAPSSSSPADVSVVMPPISVERDDVRAHVDSERARAELDRQLRRRLAAGVSLLEVDACSGVDRTCWAKRAAVARGDYVVWTTLSLRGADQHVRFEIVDASAARVVATVEDTCEICGEAEFLEFTDASVGLLLGRLREIQPRAALLAVVGTPPRAHIEVDGRVVGAVPWEGELEPGPHTVTVRSRNHLTSTRQVEVSPGTRERLDVELLEDPAGRRRRLAAAGWALTGAGTVLVAAGATFWGLHGQPHLRSCAEMDAQGRCPKVYSSLGLGIGLTSAGVAGLLAATGVWIRLAVEPRRRARIGIGPGRLALEGSF
jgi:hypothetical protein